MTAKINTIIVPTTMMLEIADRDEKNALTTYLSYGSPFIILSGLKALNTLIDLMTYMLDEPLAPSVMNRSNNKSINDVDTIKKSSLLHPELQKGLM